VAAALFAILGASILYRRPSGAGAVIRTALLLTAGCGAVASGLFFALLANCRLHCTSKIVSESKSPDGLRTAVWSEESCTSAAVYCPPISHVAVLVGGRDHAEVLSVRGADGLQLNWQGQDRLIISFSRGTVLHQQDRVGPVRLQVLRVGFE
jgi:hypothetical protein